MFRSGFLIAAIGFLAAAGSANADVIANNASLQNGVYFGTGNSNSGFTTSHNGPVELGLSAINRYVGPITPVGNVYTVSTGETTVPGKTGSIWDFVFSIDLNAPLNPRNQGALTLDDVVATLTLQDLVLNTTNSFNPLLIPDNTTQDNVRAQNAETLSFPGIAALLDPGFNEFRPDSYIFTLTLNNTAGALLASDTIRVNAVGAQTAVPEPITLSIFGAGVFGAGMMRRRKQKKA